MAALSPDERATALARGREVLRIESESVAALAERLDDRFAEAVELILETQGRVVLTGVGKSGLVARKIASTLASTGTPALFLHPLEGMHGDLGVLMRGDLLIAFSKSGDSDELLDLLPAVKRLGIPVIALTANPCSTLGRSSDTVIDVAVREEACPHDLAPTSSSTAALAMGDAIAMALLDLRGFGPDDFALLHPAGNLGRRLLWRVRDVMRTDHREVPRLMPSDGLGAAMHEIAHRRGTVAVLDPDDVVIGIITAGDLTRFADGRPDFLEHHVSDAMNAGPTTIGPDVLAAEAVGVLESRGIMALPVVDIDGRLLGMVHLHDLLERGLR